MKIEEYMFLKEYGVDRLDEADTVTIDRCDSKVRIGKVTEEPVTGYLTGRVPIAKVGILTYGLSDGTTRRELVPEETLFAQDSLDTIKMKPISIRHPQEVRITSKNNKKHMVGFTGQDPKEDKLDGEQYMTISITVTDSDSISDIKSGLDQLSPGYRAVVLLKPGVWKGEKYDGIQISRVYNHLAVVSKARGGETLKINHGDSFEDDKVDGFDMVNEDNKPPKHKQGEAKVLIKIGRRNHEVPDEVADHIDSMDEKMSALTEEIKNLKAKVSTVEADRDTFKDKLEKAEKRDSADDIKSAVKARLSIERVAEKHLDKETVEKIDSMSDNDIKKVVILKAFPKADLKDRDDSYINGRYQSAVETLDGDYEDKNDAAMNDTRKKLGGNGNSEGKKDDRFDADAARERATRRLRGEKVE